MIIARNPSESNVYARKAGPVGPCGCGNGCGRKPLADADQRNFRTEKAPFKQHRRCKNRPSVPRSNWGACCSHGRLPLSLCEGAVRSGAPRGDSGSPVAVTPAFRRRPVCGPWPAGPRSRAIGSGVRGRLLGRRLGVPSRRAPSCSAIRRSICSMGRSTASRGALDGSRSTEQYGAQPSRRQRARSPGTCLEPIWGRRAVVFIQTALTADGDTGTHT